MKIPLKSEDEDEDEDEIVLQGPTGNTDLVTIFWGDHVDDFLIDELMAALIAFDAKRLRAWCQ